MNKFTCTAIATVLSAACALPAHAVTDPPITIDTHVDIPFTYMREARFDPGKDTNLLVDLGKMERGGLNAAFFVIFVPQGPLTTEGYANAVAQADKKYSAIEMMVKKYPQRIRLATTPDQVMANHKAGRLSALIGIENSYSLGHDLKRLDTAYARGARYVGLVHGGNNDLCTSSTPKADLGEPPMNSAEDHGMTAFGRSVVARANELGMMVDVSHASDHCARDALKYSTAPVIASHSSARAVTDTPRDLPDDLLRVIAAKGGVVQTVALSAFIKSDPGRTAAMKELAQSVAKANGHEQFDSKRDRNSPAMVAGLAKINKEFPVATLDDFMDHIQHIVKVAGIDHVGISSDFDGGGGITGWSNATETRNVTAALSERGFSDTDIAKIWGGNLLRVWGEVESRAANR